MKSWSFVIIHTPPPLNCFLYPTRNVETRKRCYLAAETMVTFSLSVSTTGVNSETYWASRIKEGISSRARPYIPCKS